MATLFLSDLHLPPAASPLRERFRAFLEGPAREAEAVYILGDLFEYWVGDDVGLKIYAPEAAALAALTAGGVPLYFMHGNRDFMVGKRFAQLSGMQLLRDPLLLDVYGVPTLLSHGDIYCTDDLAYQRWRRFSRNPLAQWLYLRMPVSRRERVAGGLRSAKANKPESILDVNEAAIRAAFRQYDVPRMLHGHTHRPAEHHYDIDGSARERIVLSDWHGEHCEYLRADASGLQRLQI